MVSFNDPETAEELAERARALADFYESVRAFRIVDGADEVHRRSIARDVFDGAGPTQIEPVGRYDV